MAVKKAMVRAELLRTILTGPANIRESDRPNYRLWATTWILPRISELDKEFANLVKQKAVNSMSMEDQSEKARI